MASPSAQVGFPELYEQALVGPLFRPFAEPTVEEISLRTGERVLDIACGTGIVARLAKERVGPGGKVVGVDVNAQMLVVARRVAPGVDWREGDAGSLPLLPNEQFDAVVCHQGFQFFPDRLGAANGMCRALAIGGRVAIATWRPDEEAPFVRKLRDVAERHVGPIVDRRHSFGEPGAVEAVLRDAGFRDVRSQTVSRTIRFTDGSVFVRLNAMALVGMSAGSKSLSDDERQRMVETISTDSADIMRSYTDKHGLAFELSTNLTTASRQAPS